MGISKEQIELWITRLDKLNNTLDELENDLSFAGDDNISAEEYDNINKEIDKTINEITVIQSRIEKEIVSRTLTDEKAKDFVEAEKLDTKNKIDNEKSEVAELEEIEEKINENENMQLINNLINEKFEIENDNKELEIEKDALEANMESIEHELEDLKDKLNDPTISRDERTQTLDRMKQVSKEKNITNNKLTSVKSKIEENNENIKEIDNELGEYGVPNSFEAEIESFYGTGSTYSNDEKLIAIMGINTDAINKNKNDIRKQAKDKLGMKARFIKDDEIKSVLEQKLAQKRDEITRLEERGVGFNEVDLIRKVKSDLESTNPSLTQPQTLEDIVNKVVYERTTVPAPSDRTSGGGTGTRSGSNLPVPVTEKGKKKVGFFKNLYETMISSEFKEKRIDIAEKMYPELDEKQIKKYISEHTDVLNNMIRNDVSPLDIEEAKIIQKAQREEQKNKNRNNDFITKLKETVKTGGDIEMFKNNQLDEKVKKAKEDLKSRDDDR